MIRILAATIGLTFAVSAQAMDFSTADALFQQRSEGLEKVMEARAAYGELAASTSGEDKLYAVGQMTRLDYVRGEILLTKEQTEERREIFQSCIENVETINEAAYGSKTEAYYTWQLVCITFWAEASTTGQRLQHIRLLMKIVPEGLELLSNDAGVYVGTLEGGAFGRYTAGIMGNPGARAAQLYKPDLAAKLISEAMNTEARADRAFPAPLSGADYFENIFIKAVNLIHAINEPGSTIPMDEAIIVLENGIETLEDMIEDEALPLGREYETKFQLVRLKAKLAEIN